MSLTEAEFLSVLKYTPLISIDLCLIYNNEILLLKRNNDPAKGFFFTPGSRIHKNKSIDQTIKDICLNELGLCIDEPYIFMEANEHFYENSFFSSNISTHYVNLSYMIILKNRPKITLDFQHSEHLWIKLDDCYDNEQIHSYVLSYIFWLKKTLNI